VFALLVIPLTCLHLTEMKKMQVVLAIFRFLSLALMICTTIVAMASYPNTDGGTSPSSSSPSPPYTSSIPIASASGLADLIPIAIYSQIFHHSIPGIVQPLRDKTMIAPIFAFVLLSTFTFYSTLGLLLSLYFGTTIRQTCTLNWANYTGSSDSYRPPWAAFISYLIVLFPPVDILSAFPLNAITLANNMLSAVVESSEKRSTPLYRFSSRILAALCPIVGACLVRDLAPVLDYTGCIGVIIAFLFPCLLMHYSGKELQRFPGTGTFMSSLPSCVWAGNTILLVFCFSVCGLLAVLIMSIVRP